MPSPAATERHYCPEQGKNTYDKRGAETVRNKRWKEDRVKLRIYHCRECQGWHVTKEPFDRALRNVRNSHL